jgi:hypothetical protein
MFRATATNLLVCPHSSFSSTGHLLRCLHLSFSCFPFYLLLMFLFSVIKPSTPPISSIPHLPPFTPSPPNTTDLPFSDEESELSAHSRDRADSHEGTQADDESEDLRKQLHKATLRRDLIMVQQKDEKGGGGGSNEKGRSGENDHNGTLSNYVVHIGSSPPNANGHIGSSPTATVHIGSSPPNSIGNRKSADLMSNYGSVNFHIGSPVGLKSSGDLYHNSSASENEKKGTKGKLQTIEIKDFIL